MEMEFSVYSFCRVLCLLTLPHYRALDISGYSELEPHILINSLVKEFATE